MTLWRLAAYAVGIGLCLGGLGHVLLPRSLGWTAASHRDGGPLSALVVRMHVYFIGLFLTGYGAVTIAAAASPRSALTVAVAVTGLVVFAIRGVVECGPVARAVRQSESALFAGLHRAALVIWPLVVLGYVAVLIGV